MNDIELAKALGWFSLALGALEIAAPRQISRMLGLPPHSSALVRAFGAREVAAGVMVLAHPDKAPPMWARVAGDALDLAVLGSALSRRNRHRPCAAMAMAAVLGVTVLDFLVAGGLTNRRDRARRTAQRTRVRA